MSQLVVFVITRSTRNYTEHKEELTQTKHLKLKKLLVNIVKQPA